MMDGTSNRFTGEAHGPVIQANSIGTVNIAPNPMAALDGVKRPTPTFPGRAAELQRLRGGGIAVVSGLGGVGKTELVLQFAHRHSFPGGYLFVDLQGYNPSKRVEPAQALEQFLVDLGVHDQAIPQAETNRANLYRSLLAQREPMLVVLDNASSVAQVETLLPVHHQVIITSRHMLTSITGAHHIELGVLDIASSVELVGNAELAELCGRLPLALQIMAALLKYEPERPVVEWIAEIRDAQDRLDVLDDGDNHAVHAAFNLSYDLLTHEQKQLFRLLALHPGTEIGTEGAAALADLTATHTRRLLRELRRAHLLEGTTVANCYVFHDLMRLYAQIRLHEESSESQEAATGRLLTTYREKVIAAETHIDPRRRRDQSTVFDNREAATTWLEHHFKTLLACITTASDTNNHREAVAIASALHFYFELKNDQASRAKANLTAYNSAVKLGDLRAQAAASNELGLALTGLRQYDDALHVYKRALETSKATGDAYRMGQIFANMGTLFAETDRLPEAIKHFKITLRIDKQLRDRHGIAQTHNNLGICYRRQGKRDDSAACYEKATRLFRSLGDRFNEARSLCNLGHIQWEQGRKQKAVKTYLEAAAELEDVGAYNIAGGVLRDLGSMYTKLGQHDGAIRTLKESIRLFELANSDEELQQVRGLLAELSPSDELTDES